MPKRQYRFVEKKKIQKPFLKVFEIMACLYGMYEAHKKI